MLKVEAYNNSYIVVTNTTIVIANASVANNKYIGISNSITKVDYNIICLLLIYTVISSIGIYVR